MLKDFCIVHYVGPAHEADLRAITDLIGKSTEEPVLVVTKFSYMRDAQMCHGFGAPSEYQTYQTTLLRVALPQTPVWSAKGMTIPGTRYAYACDETNTTIFDSPFVNVDTWSTYQSPLILTASELLDNYAQWRVESKIPRTDLPEAFWTAFREGPDYVMSERPRCSTGIAVGVDHARKTFGPIMATAPELERAVRHIKKG